MKQFIELINRARCLNMSNYAPNPTKQDIYNQLATVSLNDVTAEQIQKLTNPVTISSDNQDSLLTMNAVNKAAMRDGSSMPGTGQIINVTATDPGVGVDILTPAKGEVWQIIALSYIVTDIVGSISHLVYLTGNYSGAPGGSVVISEKSSTDAGDNFGDVDYNPLHIDENINLQYTFYGNATSVSIRCAAIRIR